MNCPHCNYSDGWDAEKSEIIDGLKGDFFESPVKMERSELFPTLTRGFNDRQTVVFYGCPNCGKLFIEVY